MRNQPPEFWAYLAGIVDGEGTIGCYSATDKNGYSYSNWRLSIAQADRPFLSRLCREVGEGSVTKRGQTGGRTKRPMYQLSFGSRASRLVCERIEPYLRIKRTRAKAAMRWQAKVRRDSATQSARALRAAKLYKQGRSVQQIAAVLGMKAPTVNYWLRKQGVTRSLKEAQQLRRKREKR
jgi:hypothetical protein